jgi:hypothetical protein
VVRFLVSMPRSTREENPFLYEIDACRSWMVIISWLIRVNSIPGPLCTGTKLGAPFY